MRWIWRWRRPKMFSCIKGYCTWHEPLPLMVHLQLKSVLCRWYISGLITRIAVADKILTTTCFPFSFASHFPAQNMYYAYDYAWKEEEPLIAKQKCNKRNEKKKKKEIPAILLGGWLRKPLPPLLLYLLFTRHFMFYFEKIAIIWFH